MTALALQCMSAGVISFMLIKVFAPGFYAQQDTKTPVRVGLMAVAANAILNVVFIGFFKLIDWQAEHMALALASSGSARECGDVVFLSTQARYFPFWRTLEKTVYPVWYF
jgi:putative peptidoglycan lipid II flippase